ncbi:MAG: sigma 54-interacting transcriptional regulator, partial [Clostridiales bacterium]|nr:sigma 54-interacting transcriptional regulator [Clostridiales bacterium]
MEEKTTKEEYEEYNEEMSSFVESSPDGFMVTDKHGIIIKVNASFEKELSVRREDVIGRNVEELVIEDTFPASAALEVIRTRKSSTVIINRSGRKLISTATPVYNKSGEWVSVVANVRDITELNILQNKLEYQQMVAAGYIRELSYFNNQREGSMVAQSKAMQKIMDMIRALSQVDSTILITGESGTGKEVIVNQIYKTSYRYNKPFMKINCGAIPVTLFETELFGYEDGAFTGARKKGRAGYFEMTNGGTLFLDEISELDINMQVKLLRVLQEGEITRIGGTNTIHVDVRLIAATNKDLEHMVRNGQFRQDLYYRLNVVNIEVPPLRERKDDIIPLTQFFLEKYNKKYKKDKMMSMELGKQLLELDWPGNIRELENLIENMVVLSSNTVLGVEDMPDKYRRKSVETSGGKVTVEGIMPLDKAI